MPPTKLYLIGESHCDLFKSERYARAFEWIRPDVITCELSPAKIDHLHDCLEEFLKRNKVRHFQHRLVRDYFLGSYAAAIEYQQKFKGWLSTCAPSVELVDRADSLADGGLEQLSSDHMSGNAKRLEWRCFFNHASIGEMIYMSVLGIENLRGYRRRGLSLHEAMDCCFGDLILNTSARRLRQHNKLLDCFYFSEFNNTIEDSIGLNLHKRDKVMADLIMEQNGIVAHCGGIAHFLGNYVNLYKLLKERNVEVELSCLADFACSSKEKGDIYYRQMDTALVRKVNAVRAELGF